MPKLKKALRMLQDGQEPIRGSNGGPQQPGRRDELIRPDQEDRSQNLPHRSAAEIPPVINVTIADEVLREQGLLPRESDLHLVAQQFRRIKRPILSTAFGIGELDSKNSNVIMLASALPGTGKTFCSFNLATSIAKEKDVGAVLVDADVLKPNISRAFGLFERPGLIDYLLNPALTLDDILVATNIHGIIVVPTGQRHDQATELLASRRMEQFVQTLSQRFPARAIIVDTPPLLLTNEAQVLAEHMAQIVIVIEAGASTQETVTQALSSLDRNKPINAILNKARGASFREYGNYGYDSAQRKYYGQE